MIGQFSMKFEDYFCWTFLVICLLLFQFMHKWSKNLPPSPGIAFPFIGHLYMFRNNPREQIKQWADKYGNVFRLQMGSQTFVFINSFESMKEVFLKNIKCFTDRTENLFIAKHLNHFKKGIVFSTGENWKAQRSTTLCILKNIEKSNNILVENIMEELSFFVNELSKKNGEPLDIHHITSTSVSNVICSIIFGQRFNYDDPKIIQIMQILTELERFNFETTILNFMPFLFHVPFDMFQGKSLLKAHLNLRTLIQNMISDNKKSCNDQDINNYISAYIDAMKSEKRSDSMNCLDEINLARNVEVLLIAGSETMSTTILWCLLYVLHYPDAQKKIFNDILEHVGTDRLPDISDKSKMKYLTAFIMEVQRIASIGPYSLPYACNKDTTISGYTVFKGTVVIANLDAVLGSKEIWKDPETFRPERFFDEEGNIIKRKELIPFFIGRRKCLGESLAKMELFLYLSTLFQNFEFVPVSPDHVPPLRETFRILATPSPFEIRCVRRNI